MSTPRVSDPPDASSRPDAGHGRPAGFGRAGAKFPAVSTLL